MGESKVWLGSDGGNRRYINNQTYLALLDEPSSDDAGDLLLLYLSEFGLTYKY